MSNTKAVFSATGWTRTFSRDGAETSLYKSSFTEFGARDQRLEEIVFDPTSRIDKKKLFDNHGNMFEKVTYNANGSINFTQFFKYDKVGNEVEVLMYLGGERFHGKWVSTVDSNCRVIERVWYNNEGKQVVRESIEYDSKDFIYKRIRGNVAEWSYQHDDAGRLIRIVGGYFSSDDPDDMDIEYNEEAHLIKKTRYYSTGTVRSVTTYKYKDN